MATIGRAAAVVNFNWITLSGFVAWVIWIFVHILLLIGFKNRFVVLFDWAWSYLRFQRSARLITGGVEEQQGHPRGQPGSAFLYRRWSRGEQGGRTGHGVCARQ